MWGDGLRILIFAAAAALSLLALVPAASSAADVIVTVGECPDGRARELADDVASRAGATVVKIYESLSRAGGALMFRATSDELTPAQLIDAFSSDPAVTSVIEDLPVRAMSR